MVYSSGNNRLNGRGSVKVDYYFFNRAIFRNRNLEVDYMDALGRIDASGLEKGYDVVLLPQIDIASSLALGGSIRNCRIPVIGRPHDPHTAMKRDMVELAESLKVDWFFDRYDPASFYEYYPKRFKFESVYMGLEPSLCKSKTPWTERVPDRIAISGVLDERFDFLRMLYYRVYLRRPKALLPGFHYKLRTKCNSLPYVVHARDIYPGHGTDELHVILSMFKAAIAATTSFPTVKYKETPAAGCLTFMEITERNHGAYLGYEDGKSAIFINETNYKKKFREYLDSQDDPRWERIAHEGRRHALENLSNDNGVDKLVSIMRRALGE